jgi:hypothetical protein
MVAGPAKGFFWPGYLFVRSDNRRAVCTPMRLVCAKQRPYDARLAGSDLAHAPQSLLRGSGWSVRDFLTDGSLADWISTPADRITRTLTTGGHLGLFMGREALQEH